MFTGTDEKRSVSPKSACCCITFIIILAACVIVPFFIKIAHPQELEFTISNATLTRFEFSPSDPSNTVSYSLALSLTITNPNNKGGVYFERFQVIGEYRDKTFGMANLMAAPFQLGPRNTTALEARLEGNQALDFEKEKDVEKYTLERESRVFSIDVKIALRLRNVTFKKTKKYLEPSKIDCYGLKVPLSGNNSSNAMVFKPQSCTNVYIFTHRPQQYQGGW